MKTMFKLLLYCAALAIFATACVFHNVEGQCGDTATNSPKSGTCSDTAQ